MIDIPKFMHDGWIIVDIPQTDKIKYMTHNFGSNIDWEVGNVEYIYRKLHVKLSEDFWAGEYSLEIADAMLPIIQQLIGLDIMVQYMPYLRIARPNKPQDNIGYHRDTQYGQTPYELAVHIPFVDLDEKSAIRVISGSHLMPESTFERVTADGKLIEKGSIENHMGRPWMPKCLKVPDGMETTPLVMKVGQAAIFSPAIFHGQEINEGDVTRVSCDLRFVSTIHADKVRMGKCHAGYVEVSKSPVEMAAKKYFEANSGNI